MFRQKRLEKLPESISFSKGRLFDGDLITWLYDHALTNKELVGTMLTIGRNDARNPKYRFGKRVLQEYFNLCFNANFLFDWYDVDSIILNKLRMIQN